MDDMSKIYEGIHVLLILLGISSPIIIVGVVYYLKKRLEHRQIMTAIEKGTPLSEIIPPKPQPAGPAWIRYVSVGVALVIIGLAFWAGGFMRSLEHEIAVVVFGVGAGWLVRGLLHRKYYLRRGLKQDTTPKPENSA